MMENMPLNNNRPIVRVTDNDVIAAMQILTCIARPDRPEKHGKLMQEWFWARKRFRREKLPELPFAINKKGIIEQKLITFRKDLWRGFRAGAWLQYKILGESADQHHWFADFKGVSVRSLAAKYENQMHSGQIKRGEIEKITSSEDRNSNARSRIWQRRLPVLHMALAAGNEIALAHKANQSKSAHHLELEKEWEKITPEAERAFAEGDQASAAISEWNRLSKAVSEERRRNIQPVELEAIIFNPIWVAPALEQAEQWALTAKNRGIIESEQAWLFRR